MATVHWTFVVIDPNPMYLSILIIRSTKSEYPVRDLCIQQKWNTSDKAKMRIDGSIEHPTIVSAIANSHPTIAHIV